MVTLVGFGDEPVEYVNPEHVVAVRWHRGQYVEIATVGDNSLSVTREDGESPAEATARVAAVLCGEPASRAF